MIVLTPALILVVLGQTTTLRPPIGRVELETYTKSPGRCRFEVTVLLSDSSREASPRRARAGEAWVDLSAASKIDELSTRPEPGRTVKVDFKGQAVIEVPTASRCLLTALARPNAAMGLLPVLFAGPPGDYRLLVYLPLLDDLQSLGPYTGRDVVVRPQITATDGGRD